MSINDSIGNSTIGSTAPAEGTAEPGLSQGVGIDQEQPAKGSSAFATRANKSSSEGLSKGKLLLLGGGLAVAVLFFIITAIAGHAPKKQIAAKPQAQQQKQTETKPAKGSVTPVMETVRTAAPDNSAGQLGPGDIRRTRASTGPKVSQSSSDATENPATAKPRAGRTLASVKSEEGHTRPAIVTAPLFRGNHGTLAVEIWSPENKSLRGAVAPLFYTAAGEVLDLPERFAKAIRNISGAVACPGCKHTHVAMAPATNKGGEL